MERPENNPNCSLYQVPPTFRNVANRQTDRQADKSTDNDENITFAMAKVIICHGMITNLKRFPHVQIFWLRSGWGQIKSK